LDVVKRWLGVARAFDDVALAVRGLAQAQRSEFDAELAQELLPARALRGKIDGGSGHDERDPPPTWPWRRRSLAMIRVMREEAGGSIQLLGHDDADEPVRQC